MYFLSCVEIKTIIIIIIIIISFPVLPKLAKKYKIELCSRSSETIHWSADSFQINDVTSMS